MDLSEQKLTTVEQTMAPNLNVSTSNVDTQNQNLEKINKMGQHSIYEIIFYFIIVIGNIAYMLYSVFKAGEEFFDDYFLDFYNDFTPGWSFVERRKDVGDTEWILGMKVLNLTIPILFVHLIVSEFFKTYGLPWFLELWHILTGVFFVFYYLGYYAFMLFLIQPIVYFIIVQLRSRRLIWLITVIFLLIQHYLIELPNDTVDKGENLDHRDKLDVTIISLAWTNLRCVNFFLDAIDDEKLRKTSAKNIVKLLSYMFYLPLFYFGPIILFSDFRSSKWYSPEAKRTSFFDRLIIFGSELLRYAFWWFIFELMLHYLYVNVLLYNSDFLKLMNYHALYGVGYLMGQLFHVKYVIFYGLACSITKFELECPVPPNPKCISRIHLYSDMWKNFDRGLYLFMVKYIYKPLVSVAGKLLASLLCFTFVFVWHGLYPHVLIWSLLNYIGVSIESFGKELIKMEETKGLKDIDYNVFRRFKCLLASPLLLMSAIAFFYYHGGKEVGDIFVQKILFGSAEATILTLLVLYCFCQVCTEIERIELLNKNPICSSYITTPLQYCCPTVWRRKKPKRTKSSKKLDKQRELFNLLAQKNRIRTQKTIFFAEKLIKHRSTGQINMAKNYYKPRTPNLDQRRTYNWTELNQNVSGTIPMTFVDEYIKAQQEKLVLPKGENQYYAKEPYVLQDEHPTKELSQESFETGYNSQNSTFQPTKYQDVEELIKANVPMNMEPMHTNIEITHQMNPNKPPIPQKTFIKNEQSKLPKAKDPYYDSNRIKHRNILSAQGDSSKKIPTSSNVHTNENAGDNLETHGVTSDELNSDDLYDNKKNLFTRFDQLCKSKLKKRKLWNIDRSKDK